MLFVGVAGSVACLTLLFRSMRALMASGMSSCASGGPYEIANPCPKGVAWLTPASIWGGLAFVALASVASAKLGRASIAWLAWPALFLSLGANFWQFGLKPVGAAGVRVDGPVWGWIVCAVLFTAMGLGPLLLAIFSTDGRPGRGGAGPAATRAAAAGTRIRAEATPPPFRPTVITTTGSIADDLVDSLERLAALHRDGAITDEEYADAKRRLLEDR